MKKLIIAICVVVACLTSNSHAALIQESDFTYLGAFRVPSGDLTGAGSTTFDAGGDALTFNPINNSLIMAGHRARGKLVGEFSIPDPVISSDISTLNTATLMQIPIDITEGNWDNILTGGAAITDSLFGGIPGGFLFYNGQAYGSAWAYYEGAYDAARSHFKFNYDWAASGAGFSGMYIVGESPYPIISANSGFIGGSMVNIPASWQTALGGPALTGIGSMSIIERSSSGPCAWVFDPETMTEGFTAPAEMLVGYPLDHQTLGIDNLVYNRAVQVRGMAFPPTHDSVLFVGLNGRGFNDTGDACYGYGTDDIELHGTPISEVVYCYDPTNDNKGYHSYPYVYTVWAYDAADLAATKAGTKEAWEVVPYAQWDLPIPYTIIDDSIGSATYDDTTHRLYVSQKEADPISFSTYPIIHVFELATGDAPLISIITAPQSTTDSTITITGTTTPNATSGSAITSVTCPDQTVTGTTSWGASVPLDVGSNSFVFTVTDAAGENTTASVTITRTVIPSGDTFTISGCTIQGVTIQ